MCDDDVLISQDPAHRDSEPDLVFEDMTVMSDFELHCLCREEQVSQKRIHSISDLSKNSQRNLPFRLPRTEAFFWVISKKKLRDVPKNGKKDCVTTQRTERKLRDDPTNRKQITWLPRGWSISVGGTSTSWGWNPASATGLSPRFSSLSCYATWRILIALCWRDNFRSTRECSC